MYRMLGVLLTTATIAFASSAQEPAPYVPWANKAFVKENTPAVITHNFGVVPYGVVLTHKFEMENIWAIPIQVGDPEIGCGCVKVLKYTRQMDSRERGIVEVQMDTRRIERPDQEKLVTVKINFGGPKARSQAVLMVRATARRDVSLQPSEIQFGTVVQNQKLATQTVDIHYTGKMETWAITEIPAHKVPIDVSVKQVQRGRNHVVFRLTATLKQNAPPGQLQEELFLKTNDPATPLLTIPVNGMIKSPVAAIQGSEQKLDTIKVGESTSRKLILRAQVPGTPFRIMSVEGEGDGLTVEYNRSPARIEAQVVTLNFSPTQAGELRRQITIYTDTKEVIKVDVRGIVNP